MTYGNPQAKQVEKVYIPFCSICSSRYMAGAGLDTFDGKIKCWFDMFPRDYVTV